MKLIIKNLKQVVYNVEIPSEKSTILDLKKEIEKAHGFDSSALKLLKNGVILEDSKKLEDYQIKEETIIIMMISKVKPKNINSSSEISQPKKEEKKEENKKETKKPEKPKEKKQEQNFTQQINSLVDMGFERAQAEAAIKAAKGQIDLAIEYLYNGIPEGKTDNDLTQEQQAQEEGEEGGEDNNDNDDPVKNVASIAKILCKNDPSTLATLLQNLQQTDSDLFNLIKEREEEFKNYLEQPIDNNDYKAFQNFGSQLGMAGLPSLGGGLGSLGGSSHGTGQRQIRLNLTQQDREAINRLKDLGNFSEAEVIQAYIACDKNEELTANFLFEQKLRDEEEGNKNNNNNNNNEPKP